MKEFILFLMTFLFVFLIYQIFIIRKYKKGKAKKQLPEINYLLYKYHINLKKINYKRLLNIVAFTSSLDIALLVTITFLLDSLFIELLVVLVLAIPTIIVSYGIIGKYYKKKGLVKNV